MKKTLVGLTSLALLFSSITPGLASANSGANEPSINVAIANEIEVTTENNIVYAKYFDGENAYEAQFNPATNELYLNGELIPYETVRSFKELGESLSLEESDSLDGNIITPFSADQGAGVGITWVYEYTDYGSINVAGMTVGAIATVLATIFSKGKTIPLLAGAATVIASSISSGSGTVWYKRVHYTKKNTYFPSLRDPRDVISFYKYSGYTGLITTVTIE